MEKKYSIGKMVAHYQTTIKSCSNRDKYTDYKNDSAWNNSI